jgi:hypothetical protein
MKCKKCNCIITNYNKVLGSQMCYDCDTSSQECIVCAKHYTIKHSDDEFCSNKCREEHTKGSLNPGNDEHIETDWN